MYSSETFYTQFAQSYAEYASERKAYILAVDNIIKDECVLAKTMIDVGAGDGERGRRIADLLGVKNLTLIDSSDGMVALSQNIPNAVVVKADISGSEFISGEKYNVVLCLWNVLGHVPSTGRWIAFNNLAALVDDSGVIFLDVNNRYNIPQYGVKAVIRNIYKDLFSPKESNGDFDLSFSTKAGILETSVHIFSPVEVENLIKSAGLRILKRQMVNYKTGESSKSIFGGQLVYKLSKI